jgi:hypothetical protein
MILNYFNIFIFLLVIGCHDTLAANTATVYDYDESGDFVPITVVLEDLISQDSFNGKYFKIVKGKVDKAIHFEDDQFSTRAAHVYHHLTKARKYFKQIKNVNDFHLDSKVTIRLDITNAFDNFGHFAHDDFDEQFNTAVTIPESDDWRIPSIPPWTKEIWFRPSKEILIDSQLSMLATLLDSRETKTGLQIAVIENTIYQLFDAGVISQLFSNLQNNWNFLSVGIGLAAIEFMPKLLRWVGSGRKRKFYLDTGMIPEIIYHEYAHLALSDKIPLTSTPVIEGFANYFAGKISGKGRWGNRPGRYTTDRGRNAFANDLYSFRVESNLFSTGDFVYKLLWGLRDILSDHKTDILLYHIRKNIGKGSNIKFDLVNSIFENLLVIDCDDNNHRIQLHKFMQRLGV